MCKTPRKYNKESGVKYYAKNKEKRLAYGREYRKTAAGKKSEQKRKEKRNQKLRLESSRKHKKCKRCGESAPAYTFMSKRSQKPHRSCDKCRPIIKLEQDQLNRDRASEYYRKNKKFISLENKLKYRTNPAFNIWISAEGRARRRGIKFTIKYTDVIVPEFCPVLGIKLECAPNSPTANSPTIDRFNNELGYTPENIRVISYRANSIKSDATLEEIEKVALYMRSSP